MPYSLICLPGQGDIRPRVFALRVTQPATDCHADDTAGKHVREQYRRRAVRASDVAAARANSAAAAKAKTLWLDGKGAFAHSGEGLHAARITGPRTVDRLLHCHRPGSCAGNGFERDDTSVLRTCMTGRGRPPLHLSARVAWLCQHCPTRARVPPACFFRKRSTGSFSNA